MSLLLAIDIGNTNTECGIYAGEKLVGDWRLSSDVSRTADECWEAVVFFAGQLNIDTTEITAAAIASVVPSRTASYVRMSTKYLKKEALLISIDSCPFLDVRYENPRAVGADRLCNGVAGYAKYGGPLIVVDFGTAITLDVVSEDGGYLGGVILPGPLTSAASLHKHTEQLPQVALNFPKQVIGTNTEHSIRAGLTWGVIDMVDGIISRISDQLGVKPKVIATGGLSHTYSEHSAFFTKIEQDIVLEGIRLIHEKAQALN